MFSPIKYFLLLLVVTLAACGEQSQQTYQPQYASEPVFKAEHAELLERNLSNDPELAKYPQQITNVGERGSKLISKLLFFRGKTLSMPKYWI